MRIYWPHIIVLCLLLSCDSGYQKEDGKWLWVSYDEAAGKRTTPIDKHDYQSFEVLENKKYARDKNSVFYLGSIIKNADPKSFTWLKAGYSKDENHVFLDAETIIFAKPDSFEPLEFPYSKDDAHVFCGTIPLSLKGNEIAQFRVTNEDKLMSGMKSTTLLSHFIEVYPDYQWLDTLDIEGVIIGEWGTGETHKKKFKGFEEVTK